MLLSQEQIAEALHFEPNQTARIEACLRSQGIPYMYGKGGSITTTSEAITYVLLNGKTGMDTLKIDGINIDGKAA